MLRDMRSLARVFAAAALLSAPHVGSADAYNGSPKLAIILVFDQFRGDYLDRYRADFHAKNGWNLFLKQGAHFTECYYDYANLVTAAGHSTIGTASYTDGHGIPLNQWWVTGSDGVAHEITSVEDSRFKPPAASTAFRGWGVRLPGRRRHRERRRITSLRRPWAMNWN